MGFDGKYGRITTERLEIPEDEPVMLFRGRDRILPEVIRDYAARCQEAGSPEYHVQLTLSAAARIEQWQTEHPDRVKTPDSARLRELMEEQK